MALHKDFPESPHAILDPSIRWFPADEARRETGMDKLMPPLVAQLRQKVKQWRDRGYAGATDISRSIGDSRLELLWARFLEDCEDVVSNAKNYLAVHFKLDYVNADGDITNYYPDFLVKANNEHIAIVETKGQEDVDAPLTMQRLRQWCEDVNRVQKDAAYDFVYVDQESFETYHPDTFKQLLASFREYKD